MTANPSERNLAPGRDDLACVPEESTTVQELVFRYRMRDAAGFTESGDISADLKFREERRPSRPS